MNLQKNKNINYNYMIILYKNFNNNIKYLIKQQYLYMVKINLGNQHFYLDL